MSSFDEKTRPKVTLIDVARRAGVGTATVDRVLNERENVSDTARKKVLAAARELGLKRILPTSHHRLVRIEVLLARPELPLITRISDEFKRLASRLDRTVLIQRTFLPDESPGTLASALLKTRCHGVVVYAQDHPLINDAIENLHYRGVKVVTMISDLPSSRRVAYAGMNHYQAGRTAGSLIAKMIRHKGPLVILCNHQGFQSHESRIRGVKDYLENNAPDITVACIVEGGDNRDLSDIRLREAFHQHRDTVAVYNVGAANLGVAAAIKADILYQRPVFLGHELTRYTAQLLREGTMTLTIDQVPELQSRFAISVLLRELDFADEHSPEPPYKSPVPSVLYVAENIPEGFDPDL